MRIRTSSHCGKSWTNRVPTVKCIVLLTAIWIAVHGLAGIVLVAADDKSEQDLDRRLTVFCQCGLLQNRGVAITVFADSTDARIYGRLEENKAFQLALGVSDADLDKAKSIRRSQSRTVQTEEFTPVHQRPDEHSEKLRSVIAVDHRKFLLYIYLQLEGLQALCRSEFVEALALTPATHRSIRMMAQEAHKKALPGYQAFFIDGVDRLDRLEYLLGLRQLSVELDTQILDILTRPERIKLLELVRESLMLRTDVVDAPEFLEN